MSRESALVSADWVEENLDTPNVVLVEVDEDTAAYDKNHIRNAVRIDWQDDLQDRPRLRCAERVGRLAQVVRDDLEDLLRRADDDRDHQHRERDRPHDPEADAALYTGLTGSRFALYSADTFAQDCGLPSSPIDPLLVGKTEGAHARPRKAGARHRKNQPAADRVVSAWSAGWKG